MSTLEKLLSKLTQEERSILEPLIEKIISLDWGSLDIKKLKGYPNFFRLRKDNIRIIYQLKKDKTVYFLTIEKRTSKTYK